MLEEEIEKISRRLFKGIAILEEKDKGGKRKFKRNLCFILLLLL